MISLDLTQIVFSRRETNWAISTMRSWPRQEGLFLRHLHGGMSPEVYQIQATFNGQVVDVEVDAKPTLMRLQHAAGQIEIIMPEPNMVRFQGKGLGLRLTSPAAKNWGTLVARPEGRWSSIVANTKMMISALAGQLEAQAGWGPSPGELHRHHRCDPFVIDISGEAGARDGVFDVVMDGYESEWEPRQYESFAAAQERVTQEYAAWMAAPSIPPEYSIAGELAAYLCWSAIVPAGGNFRTPTMLTSKNGMLNAWNWDNYFNAWASSYRDSDLCWDQFMLHLGHQHPQGALPDGINEATMAFTYAKPPVHGWILRRIMERTQIFDNERLAQVYESLCLATEWWFTYRDDDGDGICQYHHGNDSGWDDATAFDVGVPMEAPDLNALLVLQMDVLADIARRLNRQDDADSWKTRADAMLARFIDHSWREGQFRSMQSGTHNYQADRDCLLNFMPLVLGKRLPEDILDDMVAGLLQPGRFLTEWGLATEAVDSPEFHPGGYWRGAIWAPTMMFVVDGLADAGRLDIATDLARRYCELCRKSGFAENFHSISGKGQYDRAYTWTASVFTILAHEYLATDKH